MCQLLGMNCNIPTDICFSFEGFHTRGGVTDDHRDGWGIAFFEEKGCRLFIDHKSSVESPIAELIRHYPIRSTNVIAHIRKATQGEISLKNTHPFMRELWGQYWIFAHNGNLKDFYPGLSGQFTPVGTTDSERAFCLIMERLRQDSPQERPPLEKVYQIVATISESIAENGPFNFLLSNGEYLLTYCSTELHYIIRQTPFAQAHLIDRDISIDFNAVTGPKDRVAIIATTPLTDNEAWSRISPGELLVFRDGLAMTTL